MTLDDIDYLGPLLTDPSRIKREAVRRRKPFDEKSLSPDDIPDHEAKGWQVDRKLKRKTKVKREKEIDERLENRFWMLLFKLGYPELSDGRSFTILIDRKGAEPLRKQVDVFGKDDETVVVAECKASAKLTRRTLQKDIEEFANLKGPISSAVRSHYGTAVKLKIIWLFVTENIIWSTPDKQRALGENIQTSRSGNSATTHKLPSIWARRLAISFLQSFSRTSRYLNSKGRPYLQPRAS